MANLATVRAGLVLVWAVGHGVGSAAAGVALRRLRASTREVTDDAAVIAALADGAAGSTLAALGGGGLGGGTGLHAAFGLRVWAEKRASSQEKSVG